MIAAVSVSVLRQERSQLVLFARLQAKQRQFRYAISEKGSDPDSLPVRDLADSSNMSLKKKKKHYFFLYVLHSPVIVACHQMYDQFRFSFSRHVLSCLFDLFFARVSSIALVIIISAFKRV